MKVLTTPDRRGPSLSFFDLATNLFSYGTLSTVKYSLMWYSPRQHAGAFSLSTDTSRQIIIAGRNSTRTKSNLSSASLTHSEWPLQAARSSLMWHISSGTCSFWTWTTLPQCHRSLCFLANEPHNFCCWVFATSWWLAMIKSSVITFVCARQAMSPGIRAGTIDLVCWTN